eukprot:c22652_g1_i1 orf=508-1320(-)
MTQCCKSLHPFLFSPSRPNAACASSCGDGFVCAYSLPRALDPACAPRIWNARLQIGVSLRWRHASSARRTFLSSSCPVSMRFSANGGQWSVSRIAKRGVVDRMEVDVEGRKKRWAVVARSFFNPRGGRSDGGGGLGRFILNLTMAGLFIYLTFTGKLGWVFEAGFYVWLLFLFATWFTELKTIKGPCPNCGNVFQVFEFSMKEQPRLCPYCTQPFKLENRQFVRDDLLFSSQQFRDFKQPFGGFGAQPTPSRDENSVVVVDVEAEVRDKD